MIGERLFFLAPGGIGHGKPMPDATADNNHHLSDGCGIDGIQLPVVSVAVYGTLSFFQPLGTFPAGYPVHDAISGFALSSKQSHAIS